MDFSLEEYLFPEYLENVLASIKLVAFLEINTVMVYGGSFPSLTHSLGDMGGRYVWWLQGDTDLFRWTKGFANTHGFCCHSWSKLIFGAFSLNTSAFNDM